MYLKKEKIKNITYLKLVESVWDKETKKRKKRIILNLGRLDTLMDNGLPFIVKRLAETVNKELIKSNYDERKKSPNLRDIKTMESVERLCYGHIIYKTLWDKYDFTNFLNRLKRRSKIEFNLSDSVYLMTINQLLNPSSKLKLWENKTSYFKTKQIELHHFYRSLDLLAEHKNEVEQYIFQKNANLFNMELDIVFYDVTTFYFESQKADNLKDFGFDKDNKVNNVHIVMGLLIDKTGRPVGYELFKGNTYEGHTLIKTIEKLKKRFKIGTVVIVADKGLNSGMNLKEIRQAGYHYIVSGRLKNMNKKTIKRVLDEEGYRSLSDKDLTMLDKYDDNHCFTYKVLDYNKIIKYKESPEDKRYKKTSLKEKLICTYSSKRAEKDSKDRERMIDKANDIIASNDKSKLNNKKGHKKYVDKKYPEEVNPDNYQMRLNQKKIEEDQKFDGYYIIESSKENLSAKDVISNYHYLYKIEESFRIMKSTMQVRPINHWTPKRIEGHFVMSFFAFLLERELELRLLKNNKTKSPGKIKEALNSLEFNKVKIENEDLYLRNKHMKLASDIMAVLKLKQPQNLFSKQEVENYMNQFMKT